MIIEPDFRVWIPHTEVGRKYWKVGACPSSSSIPSQMKWLIERGDHCLHLRLIIEHMAIHDKLGVIGLLLGRCQMKEMV